MWGGWRRVFLIFAAVGLFCLPAEGVFALASALALMIQYLFLAHTPGWTVYYLEIQPVFAFVTAVGLWRAAVAASRALGRARTAAGPRGAWNLESACMLAVVLASLVPSALDAARIRDVRREQAGPQERFRALLRSLPGPSVVFVRYGRGHDPDRSLVVNEPEPARARVWVVHDRGEDDMRLLKLAPDRVPYLYDEAQGRLVPLPRAYGAAPL